MTQRFKRLAATCAFGVLAMSAHFSALNAAQAARMELRKIADDVYVMQHPTGSSNSMFVVTPEGVVVWDGDIRTSDQVFAAIRPACTMVEVSRLISPEILVEIEADAVVGAADAT